jgi:hypothetical protein
MTDVSSLRDTVTPKSNQLNADDLISGPRTITITSVKRSDGDQPISIGYEGDNGRPYLPCKSMRRVMIHAWGDDGRVWVGKSMTVYNDPEVKWAGVKVGGIRISHMSDISRTMDIALTATKGKRTPYQVKPLTVASAAQPAYPDDLFDNNLSKMLGAISTGKSSFDKVVSFLEKTGKLTDQQKAKLTVAAPAAEQPQEEQY